MKKKPAQEKRTLFFWWILLFISFFFLINNITQLKSWWQADKILESEEQKISQLKDGQKKKIEQKEHAQTDDYVLKEAREKLGLVKPNEVKVIVPDWEPEAILEPVLSQANWKKWLKAFHL
ncbi:MAG: septum formation initiator family protein [Candidatus Shapirobacteria bacterium]